ncbi:MAG: hypothetical protein WDW38_009864 [Sanguina aurantia]
MHKLQRLQRQQHWRPPLHQRPSQPQHPQPHSNRPARRAGRRGDGGAPSACTPPPVPAPAAAPTTTPWCAGQGGGERGVARDDAWHSSLFCAPPGRLDRFSRPQAGQQEEADVWRTALALLEAAKCRTDPSLSRVALSTSLRPPRTDHALPEQGAKGTTLLFTRLHALLFGAVLVSSWARDHTTSKLAQPSSTQAWRV